MASQAVTYYLVVELGPATPEQIERRIEAALRSTTIEGPAPRRFVLAEAQRFPRPT
jgi:hypothetical protein